LDFRCATMRLENKFDNILDFFRSFAYSIHTHNYRLSKLNVFVL
jgi:hypothetical protein